MQDNDQVKIEKLYLNQSADNAKTSEPEILKLSSFAYGVQKWIQKQRYVIKNMTCTLSYDLAINVAALKKIATGDIILTPNYRISGQKRSSMTKFPYKT